MKARPRWQLAAVLAFVATASVVLLSVTSDHEAVVHEDTDMAAFSSKFEDIAADFSKDPTLEQQMRQAAHHAAKRDVQRAQASAGSVAKAQQALSQVSALEKKASKVLSRVKASQRHTVKESNRMSASLEQTQRRVRTTGRHTAQKMQQKLSEAVGTEQNLLSRVKHSQLEHNLEELRTRESARREHQVALQNRVVSLESRLARRKLRYEKELSKTQKAHEAVLTEHHRQQEVERQQAKQAQDKAQERLRQEKKAHSQEVKELRKRLRTSVDASRKVETRARRLMQKSRKQVEVQRTYAKDATAAAHSAKVTSEAAVNQMQYELQAAQRKAEEQKKESQQREARMMKKFKKAHAASDDFAQAMVVEAGASADAKLRAAVQKVKDEADRRVQAAKRASRMKLRHKVQQLTRQNEAKMAQLTATNTEKLAQVVSSATKKASRTIKKAVAKQAATAAKAHVTAANAAPQSKPAEQKGDSTHPVHELSQLQYMGCFSDRSPDHDLPMYVGQVATPDACAASCKIMHKGYRYAAVQNGDRCFCGTSYGRHGNEPAATCFKRCAHSTADSEQRCGGVNRNSVYRLD